MLDEIHAYRGIQSTEIGFLIHRLKERLQPKQLACIGTSSTIGDEKKKSGGKARKFAADILGAPFVEPNPIRSTSADPKLRSPSHCPSPAQYCEAANALRAGKSSQEVLKKLGLCGETVNLAEALARDENLRRDSHKTDLANGCGGETFRQTRKRKSLKNLTIYVGTCG